MNSLAEEATNLEVENMIKKGAIREAIPKDDQFLSNIFVTPKGDEGVATDNKFERTESVHTLHPLQNGRLEGRGGASHFNKQSKEQADG